MFGKKLWALLLCFCFFVAVMPAFAADPDVTTKDLKGISPQRHRYIFSVLGGAAVGDGIGVLLGSGNDITKGLVVGAGGVSALYLLSHPPATVDGWRHCASWRSYPAF